MDRQQYSFPTNRIITVTLLTAALLAPLLLTPLRSARAQFEKSDWRVVPTNVHVEFTGASVFSLAKALFVDDQGDLWDTWDTAMTLTPYHLDVINSDRKPIEHVRFTDVEYNTDSSGFICGEQGILLQTKDWGKVWKQRYFKNLDLLYFYDMAFVNSRQGVLIGVTGNDSLRYKGIVYRTDDGGDTWEEVPNVEGIGFSRVHHDLEKNKLIINAIGAVLISDDRGKTWKTIRLPEGELMRATILTGDHGISVGANGRILLSEDGGEKWKEAESPTESNLINISRYSPGQWYMVGDGGEVWHTRDFGKTWEDMRINKDIRLNGVKRMGPRLVVWGNDGIIMVRGLGGRR